jgi:hypothetical protein
LKIDSDDLPALLLEQICQKDTYKDLKVPLKKFAIGQAKLLGLPLYQKGSSYMNVEQIG